MMSHFAALTLLLVLDYLHQVNGYQGNDIQD
jgi:hypothetical protein